MDRYGLIGFYLGPLRLTAITLDYGQPGIRLFGWCVRAIWIPGIWRDWAFAFRLPRPSPKESPNG